MVLTVNVPTAVIAIDPGASGACVLRNVCGEILSVSPFRGYSSHAAAFCGLVGQPKPVVVVEKVWASPIMGPSQAFAFGGNYEGWIAAAKVCGLDVFTVTPQAWQRVVALDVLDQGPARKQALKSLAQSRHPGLRVTLATADALLISDYALDRIRAGHNPGEAL